MIGTVWGGGGGRRISNNIPMFRRAENIVFLSNAYMESARFHNYRENGIPVWTKALSLSLSRQKTRLDLRELDGTELLLTCWPVDVRECGQTLEILLLSTKGLGSVAIRVTTVKPHYTFPHYTVLATAHPVIKILPSKLLTGSTVHLVS